MNKKFKSGNYLAIRYERMTSRKWIIDDNPDFENYKGDYKLIHKKHEKILDAYLKDDKIAFEYWHTRAGGYWQRGDDFIGSYDETLKYRLKEKESELISVPHSDIQFYKPNFECQLLKKVNNFIIGYVQVGEATHACRWDLNGLEWESIANEEFDLTPYQKLKEWYELDENFPCILFSNSTGLFIVNRMCDFKQPFRMTSKYRLATDEEKENLFNGVKNG